MPNIARCEIAPRPGTGVAAELLASRPPTFAREHPMIRTIGVAVLGLLGLYLFGGGLWLAAIAGSPFYLLLGALVLVSAFLLYQRRPAALILYGATLLITLIWSIYE